ncbi:MAG: periplasmic heavy metal sensor [Pseudomonadota bacterium]
MTVRARTAAAAAAKTAAAAAMLAAAAAAAWASDQPYAGREAQAVSTLTESDVAALLDGAGWGLALPAELNGWPGPRHVLDLGEDLELTLEQRREVQAIFDGMQAEARDLGPRYVEAERALDAAFEDGTVEPAALADLVARAERLRAALRETHLAAHLATRPVLSRHQIMTYDRLRGYGGAGEAGGHGGHGGHAGHGTD